MVWYRPQFLPKSHPRLITVDGVVQATILAKLPSQANYIAVDGVVQATILAKLLS